MNHQRAMAEVENLQSVCSYSLTESSTAQYSSRIVVSHALRTKLISDM